MAKNTTYFRNQNANKKKTLKKEPTVKKTKRTVKKKTTKKQYDGKHAQFLRLERYAKEEALNRKGRKQGSAQTTHAVLQEVIREAEYSKHVDTNKTDKFPPRLIYDGFPSSNGKRTPIEWAKHTEAYIDKRLETGVKTYEKRIKGKKDEFQTIVKDVDPKQAILLAGVLSMPENTKGEELKSWAKDSVAWLKKKYPEGQLKGVFLHLDESCPHLHFYAISNEKDCDVTHIHDGMRAKKAAMKAYSKGELKEKPSFNGIYKKAMGELQDSFFDDVAVKHGLKRTADHEGKRVPRHIYVIRKWYQRRLDEINKEHEKVYDELSDRIKALEKQTVYLEREFKKGVKNPLNIPLIKTFIKELEQRKADIELEKHKLQVEKNKSLRILEIQKDSALTQSKIDGQWSVKFENLGKVHQIEINTLIKENTELKEVNNQLNERLSLYEEGYDSPSEALAYNNLAYGIKEIEDHMYGYDKREYRIKKSLTESFYTGKTISMEDLSYLIAKAVSNWITSFKLEREKQKQKEMDRIKQQRIEIRNSIINMGDFDIS